MPRYCPVVGSMMVPFFLLTMPPVFGSISVPSARVIKPVFGSTVSVGVADADAESEELGVSELLGEAD